MKIAIVDDERPARSELSFLIREIEPDTEIMEADSGESFLELLRRNTFDACFVDINMGDISGTALASLIKNIQPDIQITEEQLYIHGNRQGLRRVIQNVIKNGLDHGEKKISIVLERDQNQAVLRISNQVTHPEQINIDQVFERFYKADVARSKTSTGLGLSIAKELVSRMDGEIEAKIEKKEFIVEMNFPIVTDAK